MKPPTGKWDIAANGHRRELDITKVETDGQITGTARFAMDTHSECISNIFDFGMEFPR